MSQANKVRLIKAAREASMSDSDILREVLGGEYGSERRRKLVVEVGRATGTQRERSLAARPRFRTAPERTPTPRRVA